MAAKLSLLLPVTCFILVVLHAVHVEARPDPAAFGDSDNGFYTLFVFGDSFADTGNLPKRRLSEQSREWYYPYGRDRGNNRPTGRFSNAMVQSDLIARMLGRHEAPPTYRRVDNYVHPHGMNFAAGGSGVFKLPSGAPTLDKQVDHFRDLVQDGTITRRNLRNSIALVAVSGNDYARLANVNDTSKMIKFVDEVTSEIAKQVHRLKNNGARKILVNNLHPVGCTPWVTRPGNYSGCSSTGNMGAYLHGSNLQQKLSHLDYVHHVDLNTAFSNIVNPDQGSKHKVSSQFEHKMQPCCESLDPNGFCGQKGHDGKDLFSVCNDPEKYFYWDDVHPTEAGWKAVMQQLEGPIKKFLGIN
uniref:SGNH hydrolase-type esterase domain-containing protein n=1 Tax=Oryza glumipatula TaxID=40148 RepID=A0A0D9ZRN5_9ORYZ